jgi:type VI secretion system protein ImpF
MPRSRLDLVTVSLIDRLIDLEPKASAEPPLTRANSVRQLKNGVRRDLEWLLNSKRIAVDPDESLQEVNRSLYVYGLRDFSSFSLASAKDQTRLLRTLQATIKTFEPRLDQVRVVLLPSSESGTGMLRLRIEGMLKMDPAPEPVSFDTVFEVKSGACRIKGGPDAG